MIVGHKFKFQTCSTPLLRRGVVHLGTDEMLTFVNILGIFLPSMNAFKMMKNDEFLKLFIPRENLTKPDIFDNPMTATENWEPHDDIFKWGARIKQKPRCAKG